MALLRAVATVPGVAFETFSGRCNRITANITQTYNLVGGQALLAFHLFGMDAGASSVIQWLSDRVSRDKGEDF